MHTKARVDNAWWLLTQTNPFITLTWTAMVTIIRRSMQAHVCSDTATHREAVLRALGCSSGSCARSLSRVALLPRPPGVTAEEGRSQLASAPLIAGRSYGSHHLLAPFVPFAKASSLHTRLTMNADKFAPCGLVEL